GLDPGARGAARRTIGSARERARGSRGENEGKNEANERRRPRSGAGSAPRRGRRDSTERSITELSVRALYDAEPADSRSPTGGRRPRARRAAATRNPVSAATRDRTAGDGAPGRLPATPHCWRLASRSRGELGRVIKLTCARRSALDETRVARKPIPRKRAPPRSRRGFSTYQPRLRGRRETQDLGDASHPQPRGTKPARNLWGAPRKSRVRASI